MKSLALLGALAASVGCAALPSAACAQGADPLTLEQALAQHLRQVLQKHADELIGIQEAQLLLKRLADEHPDLEKELQRNVPLPRFTEVLKRLVREDISIRNLRDIAHGLIEWGPREKDTVLLTLAETMRTMADAVNRAVPAPEKAGADKAKEEPKF